MIIINECRITDNGKAIVIEASVDNLSYYKYVFIDSVVIDSDKTFSPNGPSSNPLYAKEYEVDYEHVVADCNDVKDYDDCCIYTGDKTGKKNIRIMVSAKDMGLDTLNNNIFFIYISATGIPMPCTPCGMDNRNTMTVAMNLRPVYDKAMGYIKNLGDSCDIPRDFIDFILRLKAFKLALKTGNYSTAIKYWNKVFSSPVAVKKNCGCNGNYR